MLLAVRNGIDEAYTRALIAAGAYVTIGDLGVDGGERLVARFPERAHFVKRNVTSWDDQTQVFREAEPLSPTNRVQFVVANTGIIRADEVFAYSEEPSEPESSTIDTNIEGILYTAKLAIHYSIKQNGTTPSPSQQDTTLVLI